MKFFSKGNQIIFSRCESIYITTSGVLEHKWQASLKTILFLLTSNTEATENKVQFLNFAYKTR